MIQLLKLALYILAAIGLALLTHWGAGEVGLPNILQMILAAIVFVIVLIFGFNKTGTGDI